MTNKITSESIEEAVMSMCPEQVSEHIKVLEHMQRIQLELDALRQQFKAYQFATNLRINHARKG